METFAPDSPLVQAVVPSPNRNARRGGEAGKPRAPDAIILHYTGLNPDAAEAWLADPGGAALAWLCNPAAAVSCHYLIETDGKILQLVPEAERAWHAGRGSWKGETDMNSASIGIEIVNPGHDLGLPPFPAAQIAAVIALCKDIATRWPIAPERVLAHSDIAPDRKADPGENFPWDQLFKEGVGHWVAPAPGGEHCPVLKPGDCGEAVAKLRAELAAYGYGLPPGETYDMLTGQTVRAFQRHFRPGKCDGIADGQTRATLRELARTLAPDRIS
ncbi:MAG: N-acetylmuramoyl-L-alanine amidase [Beijerinckiaceae bacterium]